MNKAALIILVFLLILVAGLVYLNKDRFQTSFRNSEVQTSLEAPTPLPTPTPTPVPINLEGELLELDTALQAINPDEFSGDDLSDTALGL